VLSHEQVESITDPDPFGPGNKKSGWVSFKSLIVPGAEIGDLCEPLGNSKAQFLDPTVTLNGKPYELQGEYPISEHLPFGLLGHAYLPARTYGDISGGKVWDSAEQFRHAGVSDDLVERLQEWGIAYNDRAARLQY
jgi:hypothetical protein